MTKMQYESPELEIRWFESEDVISISDPATEQPPGSIVVPDDDF